jgi:hypothetical protein
VISVKRFSAVAASVAVLGLTAFVGGAAAGNGGAYSIYPPGHDGATATCVGPVFGETPEQAGLAPWNGHFNGVAPVHDFSC